MELRIDHYSPTLRLLRRASTHNYHPNSTSRFSYRPPVPPSLSPPLYLPPLTLTAAAAANATDADADADAALAALFLAALAALAALATLAAANAALDDT